MNFIFSTNNQIKPQWPRDDDGLYKQARDVIEEILGVSLHDQLANYWSGEGSSLIGDGYQNWDFSNVPIELGDEVKQRFLEVNPSYILFSSCPHSAD